MGVCVKDILFMEVDMYYLGLVNHQRSISSNFLLNVKLTDCCTLFRAFALRASPPHSSTPPTAVLLPVVLQSLGPRKLSMMNVVNGST